MNYQLIAFHRPGGGVNKIHQNGMMILIDLFMTTARFFWDGLKPPTSCDLHYPMTDPCMYAIYGNMYHPYTPNVSINLPYMDPMGKSRVKCHSHHFLPSAASHPAPFSARSQRKGQRLSVVCELSKAV